MPRHYRRRAMRMRAPPRNTYKKILDYAPSSHAASTKIPFPISVGVDSVAAGQTGVTDADVPTGSTLRVVTIMYTFANVTAGVIHNWWNIQLLRANQTVVNPRVTGGNPQRNQVFQQSLRSVNVGQNMNYYLTFRIPKGFQRVREGDQWVFLSEGDAAWTDSCKIIYKFDK